MIITQFCASIKPNNEFTPKMGRQRFSNPPKVKEYFDESILKSTLAKTIPSLLYSCNRLICLSTNNCKKIGMLQFHRHSKNYRTKEIRGDQPGGLLKMPMTSDACLVCLVVAGKHSLLSCLVGTKLS